MQLYDDTSSAWNQRGCLSDLSKTENWLPQEETLCITKLYKKQYIAINPLFSIPHREFFNSNPEIHQIRSSQWKFWHPTSTVTWNLVQNIIIHEGNWKSKGNVLFYLFHKRYTRTNTLSFFNIIPLASPYIYYFGPQDSWCHLW